MEQGALNLSYKSSRLILLMSAVSKDVASKLGQIANFEVLFQATSTKFGLNWNT